MADPKGKLNTPVAFQSDGSVRALEVDDDDRLLVSAGPQHVWDTTGIVQVLEEAEAEDETTTIYTVPSGKTFYLCNLFILAENSAGPDGEAHIQINTNAPAELTRWHLEVIANSTVHTPLAFNPPIKLLAGYTVQCVSAAANVHIHGTIHGYTL